MKSDAASKPNSNTEISVYECEVHLKFRLIEEKCALSDIDRDKLLDLLIDAFTVGADDYLRNRDRHDEMADGEAFWLMAWARATQ